MADDRSVPFFRDDASHIVYGSDGQVFLKTDSLSVAQEVADRAPKDLGAKIGNVRDFRSDIGRHPTAFDTSPEYPWMGDLIIDKETQLGGRINPDYASRPKVDPYLKDPKFRNYIEGNFDDSERFYDAFHLDQELTENMKKPRVSDVPEDIAVTRRRIAEQVGGSVEQTYRKQEPTKNPFKNALRRIDRSKLEKEIPGMVREGQSYYFHTVRTGSPERASSITQSIDKNGLFYRHYGDSTNIRPFLLGPLGTEGQSRGKGPGGTTRGATSNPATYMERQSPSTRTYIIELPSDVSHIDDVGERITPNHPLYETVAEARETRSPGRSGDRPHIQVGPKGSKPNPSQQGYKMTANRQPWTGRLSADYIVGHVEDGQLTLKPQILEAVNVDQATKTPMGTVRGLLKGGLKVAATVFKVREAALFGIDISKHGPIEGTMESIGRFGGETGDLINVVGRGISAVVPETPEFYAKAGVSPPPSLAVARQLGSLLSSVGSVIGKLHDFGPQDDLDREEERERVRNIPSNPSNPSGD